MVAKRGLFDYTRRKEDIVDALSVGKKHFREIADLGGGFKVIYVREPSITFGGGTSKLYPSDFKELKRFYTSDEHVKITWMYFRNPRDRVVRSFFEAYTKLVKKHEEMTNFEVVLYPLEAHGVDTYEAIKRHIEDSDDLENRIVGGVIGFQRQDRRRYYLIKALGLRKHVPTHLINYDRIRTILESCSSDPMSCVDFRAYAFNNYVQLYAKAGKIPWTVAEGDLDLLKNTLVIGVATARYDREYYIGSSFTIAYLGKEVQSFVSASKFGLDEIDEFIRRNKGLYVPGRVIEELVGGPVGRFAGRVDRIVIFQSPVIHGSEVESLRRRLDNKFWILTHLKLSGFTKRIYDVLRDDYGAYRGVVVVDTDSAERSNRRIMKLLLVATGKIAVEQDGRLKEKNLYKGTPKPLEMSIVTSEDVEPIHLAAYISRLVLLMGKLDWEAYTTWPKVPFVVKYAGRLAEALSAMAELGMADRAEELIKALVSTPKPLRYLM